MLAAGIAVFALSAALGEVVHDQGLAETRTAVISSCMATNGGHLTGDVAGHFRRADFGPTTTVKHPGGSWTAVITLTLSQNTENGNPGEQARTKQTCDFDAASVRRLANHKAAKPDAVRIEFTGLRSSFDVRFTLAPDGSYRGAGSGLQSF